MSTTTDDLVAKLREYTDRIVAAEQEAADADARYDELLDHAPVAITELDDDGVVQAWNPRATTLLGWPQHVALGQRLDHFLVPERYRHAHRAAFVQFLALGKTTSPLLFRDIVMPVLLADGREERVVMMVTIVKKKRVTLSFRAFFRPLVSETPPDLEALLTAGAQTRVG